MNNDLLKKLLYGIPQQQEYELSEQIGDSPAYEVKPNLDPTNYPSPMAYPEPRMVPIDFSNENEVINGTAPAQPAKLNPGLPFTQKNTPLPVEATPEPVIEQPKKPSLADILSGLKKPQQDDTLKNAQSNRDDMLTNLLYMKAANTASQSMVNQKADPDFLKDHMALNENKVSNVKDQTKANIDAEKLDFERSKNAIDEQKSIFELGDKEKENDPNSNLSVAFRDFKNKYYASMNSNLKVPNDMSYADLSKSSNVLDQGIQNAFLAQERSKDRALQAELSRESKSSLMEDKKNAKNYDYMDKMNKQMRESTGFKSAQIADGIVSTIDDALKNPSAVKEIAATYETVKALDPNSAVREAEVGLLQQGLSMREKIGALASKATDNPKIYGPKFLDKMKEYAEFKRELSRRLYDREFKSVKNIASKRGISDQDISDLDPMTGMTKAAPQQKTVTKKQYSPSANKTKFIYSDGSEEIVEGQK